MLFRSVSQSRYVGAVTFNVAKLPGDDIRIECLAGGMEVLISGMIESSITDVKDVTHAYCAFITLSTFIMVKRKDQKLY